MGRALTIFFGLLAFGLLVFFCLGHREGIQETVADNARSALVGGGFGFARAAADGQTVILTGTAESAEQRDAAEAAVLAAPGVVKVDNKIALLTSVPPPGPDSSPVLLEPPPQTPGLAEDGVAVPETAETVDSSLVAPIPEAVRIVLDKATQRVAVSGRVLQTELDDERQATLFNDIAAALPDYDLDLSSADDLTKDANLPVSLSRALQQVLPSLNVAQSAQLDIDAEGIRIDARLASFADRTALQTRLDSLSEGTDLADQNVSWMLDSPPPSEDSCQKAFDTLLGRDSIMFTTNKAEIRPGSLPLLDKLVGVARDCNVTIEIEGHTDSRGTAELNEYLSQARADSVRAYLIEAGVDGSQVSAKGFGAARPIADNNTVNGRQANRRIEFRVQRTDS